MYSVLKKVISFLIKNFELLFWSAALVSLAFANPDGAHYILCPLKLMGISLCPGCGLGHAIAYLLHGQIQASINAHWLGIPALAVLLYRIYRLSYDNLISPIKFTTSPEAKHS